MWRKLGILCVLIMVMGLVACSKGDEEKKATDAPKPEDTGSAFKVGIIIGEEEAKESDFVKSALNGLDNFEEKTSCDVIIENINELDEVEKAAKSLIDKKCDLIWAVGVTYGEELIKVATQYPDTNFAVVDGQYDDIDNVTGVGFRSNEAAFLAGYIAAFKSKTGKIGFIGGVKENVIEEFRVGYEAGARYYSDDIVVVSEYSDTFTDKEVVREITKNMYASGCDVVFPATGGASVGAIEEAVLQNKYVIGVDRDQSDLGEDVVVTSVLKMVDSAVEYVCLRAKEGIDIGGQNISYGLSDGAVGIPVYVDKHIPLSEQNKIDNLKEMIVSDRLTVPKTQQELDEFKPVRE